MTQTQQPEALRLAAICETKGMFPVADELNRMHARILELEQGKCLHQIAEPAANLTSELADMLERSVTGLGHYRNSQNWSEADEEHIYECNALLERFNSSDDEREAAPQAVQPAVPQLKANCYSDDNGDYWRDCPDDCDFVEGLKVGDTYELQASIRAWSETFRVTKAPDETSDDYEVELVSSDAPAHPAEGVPAQAVQPSDALIEAVDAWFADNTGLGGCSDKDVAELAAIFATQPAAQGLEADMFWDSEDGERCGHDIESIIEDYSDGAILKIDCAKSLPSITIRVIQNAEGADYEIVDAALAAQAKQGGAA